MASVGIRRSLRSRLGSPVAQDCTLPKGATMTKATQRLHELGQSIWLDKIPRDLLTTGTLKRYVDELSVTGLTSNPTIFDHAIKNSAAYEREIRDGLKRGD